MACQLCSIKRCDLPADDATAPDDEVGESVFFDSLKKARTNGEAQQQQEYGHVQDSAGANYPTDPVIQVLRVDTVPSMGYVPLESWMPSELQETPYRTTPEPYLMNDWRLKYGSTYCPCYLFTSSP